MISRFQVVLNFILRRYTEAHEGGTPSERQIRAFRRAMQRTSLTDTAANTGTALPETAPNCLETCFELF